MVAKGVKKAAEALAEATTVEEQAAARAVHVAEEQAEAVVAEESAALQVVARLKTVKTMSEADVTRVLKLPAHLRLGVTLPGMRELLASLPADAVKQVNDAIPRAGDGTPKFPSNDAVNGYVNQYFVTERSKVDKMSVCERMQHARSAHVARANVFVSWTLATPIETLLDALSIYVREQGLSEDSTYFWVCDFVIRQNDVGTDLESLGDCVAAIGRTVLLLEPWHSPEPLRRAYCIKEVYHTQASN